MRRASITSPQSTLSPSKGPLPLPEPLPSNIAAAQMKVATFDCGAVTWNSLAELSDSTRGIEIFGLQVVDWPAVTVTGARGDRQGVSGGSPLRRRSSDPHRPQAVRRRPPCYAVWNETQNVSKSLELVSQLETGQVNLTPSLMKWAISTMSLLTCRK